MSKVLVFVTIVSVLLWCPDGHAQAVVNIEQKRIVTDTVGWAGSMNISYLLNKDVDEQYSASGSMHVQYKTSKSLYLLLANLSLLEAASKNFINSGFAHLRYNRKFGKILRWEAFSQLQFNKILQVNQRVLVGTGPRLKLLSTKKVKLYQGTLYMYEYEEIISPREFNNDHRLSTYLSGSWSPSDRATISSTWYFQPLLSDFNDNRLSGQMNLELGITKKLKFTTSFNYLHDTRPPTDIPKVAYRMRNGLTFKF